MEEPPQQSPRYRLVVIGLVLGVAVAIAATIGDCGNTIQRRAGGEVVAAAE